MKSFANHFIAHSDAFTNFLINSCKSLEKTEMVLPSAKLCKSETYLQKEFKDSRVTFSQVFEKYDKTGMG